MNAKMFEHRSIIDMEINSKLQQLADRHGLIFFDRQSLVCVPGRLECQVVSEDDKLLYFDRTHWSYEGRKRFGRMLVTKYVGLLLRRDAP